mmetsp:Transcript_11651/g.32887  ORF Transcript_11651/g.32887 Transcript_11651/m.32887 type:complete len:255 (-) Transcript_11651:1371-2135(-)
MWKVFLHHSRGDLVFIEASLLELFSRIVSLRQCESTEAHLLKLAGTVAGVLQLRGAVAGLLKLIDSVANLSQFGSAAAHCFQLHSIEAGVVEFGDAIADLLQLPRAEAGVIPLEFPQLLGTAAGLPKTLAGAHHWAPPLLHVVRRKVVILELGCPVDEVMPVLSSGTRHSIKLPAADRSKRKSLEQVLLISQLELPAAARHPQAMHQGHEPANFRSRTFLVSVLLHERHHHSRNVRSSEGDKTEEKNGRRIHCN